MYFRQTVQYLAWILLLVSAAKSRSLKMATVLAETCSSTESNYCSFLGKKFVYKKLHRKHAMLMFALTARNSQKAWTHCVDKMQSSEVLKQVVRISTIVLKAVNVTWNTMHGDICPWRNRMPKVLELRNRTWHEEKMKIILKTSSQGESNKLYITWQQSSKIHFDLHVKLWHDM